MNDPILTAVVGTNADLFTDVLALFAKDNDKILDMTYGLGVFWRNIDPNKYIAYFNDLDPARGVYHDDFRHTSWIDNYFDCVILDPPYGNNSSSKRGVSAEMYNNAQAKTNCVSDMLDLYFAGMQEAHRILKPNGYLMVKCMDEISGGKQRRNHISIFEFATKDGLMVDEDLFVLVRNGIPIMRHNHQDHARKNNSFLWVFRKAAR